jgi:predicted acylesterase/phospholipase RssA
MAESGITHLVISGAFIYGMAIYGTIRELHSLGEIDLAKIRTFYATSSGGLVAVILALGYSFAELEEYLVNRPWNVAFKVTIDILLGAVSNRGLFCKDAFVEMLEPLLSGKDLDANTTMREFRAATGVDIHLFATDVDAFESIDISSDTCPDWTVVDAVYATCCVPGFFTPLIKNGRAYIDGAFVNNCPVDACVAAAESRNAVMVVRLDSVSRETKAATATMPELVYMIANKQLARATVISVADTDVRQVFIRQTALKACDMYAFLYYKECRSDLIAHGAREAARYVAAKPKAPLSSAQQTLELPRP